MSRYLIFFIFFSAAIFFLLGMKFPWWVLRQGFWHLSVTEQSTPHSDGRGGCLRATLCCCTIHQRRWSTPEDAARHSQRNFMEFPSRSRCWFYQVVSSLSSLQHDFMWRATSQVISVCQLVSHSLVRSILSHFCWHVEHMHIIWSTLYNQY